jgi:hypothetical protein
MMRTLGSALSDDGKRALKTIRGTIQACPGAEDFVTAFAIDLAQKNDAEAAAELQTASREIVEQTMRNEPTLSRKIVNGLVIGFCELVVARRREIIAHEAGNA